MLAIDNATNNSVPVLFSVDSLVQNFNVGILGLFRPSSEGTYDLESGPITRGPSSYFTVITVKRSTLSRAFTICLLIVNWALTSVSVWVTTIIYFKGEKPPDAILLFPLTIVVTIPALRNLYVGSPPFGIFIGMSQILRPSDLGLRTNVALRCDRVLPADDNSRNLLCISVFVRCLSDHLQQTCSKRICSVALIRQTIIYISATVGSH